MVKHKHHYKGKTTERLLTSLTIIPVLTASANLWIVGVRLTSFILNPATTSPSDQPGTTRSTTHMMISFKICNKTDNTLHYTTIYTCLFSHFKLFYNFYLLLKNVWLLQQSIHLIQNITVALRLFQVMAHQSF